MAAFSVLAFLVASAGPAAATTPTPPFNQCPAVGQDTSCAILIYIDPSGTATFLSDPSQGPYDGIEDTLFGIQNDSQTPLSSFHLTGNDIFGFDGDGLCDVSPSPAGCPFGPTGYEGPGTSFANISADQSSGDLILNPPLVDGESTYFSLEGGPPTDLSITKVGPPSSAAGTVIVYALTVSNAGPNSAGDVEVTDPLPLGTSFVSATPSQGTCSSSSGTVTCELGTVDVGQTVTIILLVLAPAPGTVTNTATVASANNDSNPANNSASWTTLVVAGGGGGGGGGGGTGPGNCTSTGNTGSNVIFGTPHNDVLCGLAGNDVIHAGAGNDKVFGGRGNDTLYGGPGKDQLFGGPGKDTCFPKGSNGPSHNC